MSKQFLFAGSLVGAALFTACSNGGGGGGSSVLGLSTPDQLEVVTPVAQVGAPATVTPAATDPGFAAGSDYERDEQRVHVFDPALEPLALINNILCYMGQTGAQDLVNEGAYLAQINISDCEDGGNQSSAGSESGQSSGESGDEIEIWTIRSSREDDSSMHEVDLWVPSDLVPDSYMFVDVDIEQGASDANPFGSFELHFALALNALGVPFSPLTGALVTVDSPTLGDRGFRFYENLGDVSLPHALGDVSARNQVNVEMTDDGATGWAHVLATSRINFGFGDSGVQTQRFEIAFDDTHFLRSRDGAPAMAYERGNFTEHVWDYNLYFADGPNAGQRVERNAGFAFITDDDRFAWAGYYGFWIPEGATLADGDTVRTEVYGQDTPTTYTVVNAPGRLMRFARLTLDLTELDRQSFEWWTWDDQSQEAVFYQVEYDEVGGEWEMVAQIDPITYQATPMEPTQTIDTAAMGSLELWSDSLGGRVIFVDGDTSVTFYEHSFVDGDDPMFDGSGAVTLYGFTHALKAEISQQDAEDGAVRLDDAPDLGTPYVFEMVQSDLTLYYDPDGMGADQVVGLDQGVVPTSGPNIWGMQSGPLVTPAVAAGLNTIWDSWNASEFYVYETGHNQWNQYWGLLDGAGDFVQFDEPLKIQYAHSTADDRNDDATYDGVTFFLDYAGQGNLSGFRWEGVDFDGDDEFDRYYPIVSLQDGTALTDSDGTNYVVKAIEVEQALTEDPGYAGALTVQQAGSLILPDDTLYRAPDIGNRPNVDEAPRAVDGQTFN